MRMKRNSIGSIFILIALILFVVRFLIQGYNIRTQDPEEPTFNGARAHQDVIHQVSIGPRTPGSKSHDVLVSWLQQSLLQYGWNAEIQAGTFEGHSLKNVIAKRGEGQPWIILGAHYDSRLIADRDADPALRVKPVPGANDGASGVAVLMELARVLPTNPDQQIWLVFFDLEDQGRIEGYNWILGSQYFVENLEGKPDAVVIVDMIGDADLNIYFENNSDPELASQIWQQAAALGYSDYFIAENKYSILDDHTPFLEKGIPAVDIIDFDYPYWHTSQDTADKVSPDSLQAVGDTLQTWINSQK